MKKLLIGLLLISSGCTSLQTVTDSWIGRPVGELEQHELFGAPNRKSILSDGSELWIYGSHGSVRTARDYDGSYVSTQSHCNAKFYVKNGVIIRAMINGRCGEANSDLLPAGVEDESLSNQ